jgi:hypothetical protein
MRVATPPLWGKAAAGLAARPSWMLPKWAWTDAIRS